MNQTTQATSFPEESGNPLIRTLMEVLAKYDRDVRSKRIKMGLQRRKERMNKGKAIIYCRIAKTDNNTLMQQESVCRQFAAKQGYDIDRTFIEQTKSGKTRRRKMLQELLKYASQKPMRLKAIIVKDFSRLARSLSDLISLTDFFSRLGIKVLSVLETNNNAISRPMLNILSALEELSNEKDGKEPDDKGELPLEFNEE